MSNEGKKQCSSEAASARMIIIKAEISVYIKLRTKRFGSIAKTKAINESLEAILEVLSSDTRASGVNPIVTTKFKKKNLIE